LVLKNTTQGWSHTVHKTLAGAANSSAEVIAEAPCCTAGGGVLPLANFGTVNFSNATANGSPIGNFGPTKINMAGNSGRPKARTSARAGGGTFAATWLRASYPPGGPAPAPIGSRGRAAPRAQRARVRSYTVTPPTVSAVKWVRTQAVICAAAPEPPPK